VDSVAWMPHLGVHGNWRARGYLIRVHPGAKQGPLRNFQARRVFLMGLRFNTMSQMVKRLTTATRHHKNRWSTPVYGCINRSIAACQLSSSKAATHLHAPTAVSPRPRPHQWGVKVARVKRNVANSPRRQHCRDASFWESVHWSCCCASEQHSSTKSRASTFLLKKPSEQSFDSKASLKLDEILKPSRLSLRMIFNLEV